MAFLSSSWVAVAVDNLALQDAIFQWEGVLDFRYLYFCQSNHHTVKHLDSAIATPRNNQLSSKQLWSAVRNLSDC